MIDVFEFDSGVEGDHLLVLGAIHGKEKCGPVALQKIVEEFDTLKLNLLKGKVTFVPVCNPRAYEKNVRYIDRDLNRYMSPIDNPKVYEDHLTNFLCPLLEQADVLLDVHSNSIGGAPFAFVQGPDGEEIPFVKSIGVQHMVYGFSNAYQNAAAPTLEEREEARRRSMGTTEYMRQFGGYGFTLECGKNGTQESVEFAEYATRNALAHLGMVELDPVLVSDPELIEIKTVYYREEGEKFVSKSFNFAAFDRGAVITEISGRPHVVAGRDTVIVLPDEKSLVGEEWFYLGRHVN